jgi:predicted  nucleic acid-binding Zn-ribbon protein
MTEPENLTLQLLREIRSEVGALRGDVRELSERIDTIEIKLDGLTHAVVAGFGSLVHELDGVKQRVGRLEAEKA